MERRPGAPFTTPASSSRKLGIDLEDLAERLTTAISSRMPAEALDAGGAASASSAELP